jgi:hypothetical protein
MVHLDEKEWQDYRQGVRFFYPYQTNEVEIRVGENCEIIEKRNSEISFQPC